MGAMTIEEPQEYGTELKDNGNYGVRLALQVEITKVFRRVNHSWRPKECQILSDKVVMDGWLYRYSFPLRHS